MDIDLKAEGDYTSLKYLDWFNEHLYNLEKVEVELRSNFQNRLLENHKMIIKACDKYKPQLQNNEEYGDLLQEGLIILQMTVDKYRPIVSGRAVKFSSYLYIMLDGYLQKVFNEKFRGIKLTQTSFKNGDAKYVDFKIYGDEKEKTIENNSTTQTSIENIYLKQLIESKLNKEEINLIDLYYFQGFSYSEIGKLQNCSKQAISKRISKILKNLKGE